MGAVAHTALPVAARQNGLEVKRPEEGGFGSAAGHEYRFGRPTGGASHASGTQDPARIQKAV